MAMVATNRHSAMSEPAGKKPMHIVSYVKTNVRICPAQRRDNDLR